MNLSETYEDFTALTNICASMLTQGIASNQKVVGSNRISSNIKLDNSFTPSST